MKQSITKEWVERVAATSTVAFDEDLPPAGRPMPDVREKRNCVFCKKETPDHSNYCNWECHIEHAKSVGGKAFTPNGLSISCIKAGGDMLEHEHGDHPDYKFPVEVQYIGNEFDDSEHDEIMFGRALTDEERLRSRDETHAVIYTDGCIVVTVYEMCYAFWYLRNRKLVGGSLWKVGEWELSTEAKTQIVDRLVLNTRYSESR